MSIEAATAFKQVATEDAGLQAEVLAAAEAGGLEAVVALAAGRGYAFTAADAEAALAPAGGELSELETVAGGKGIVLNLGPTSSNTGSPPSGQGFLGIAGRLGPTSPAPAGGNSSIGGLISRAFKRGH